MTAMLWVICLFVLALPTAAAQGTMPQTVPEKFRITGIAVNATTGQPLADALIDIGLAQKQDAAQSVQTDETGRFVFEGLAPAKYWLVGERQGFLRQGYNEHSGFFTAIVVGPGLQSEDLVFRLRPDASISGTVTDGQNEAIRDAQVELVADASENGERLWTQRAQSGTDSEGHYRFSHLRPGKYYVAVSAQPWYAQNQSPGRPLTLSGEANNPASSDNGAMQPPAQPSPLDVAYPLTYSGDAVEPDNAALIILKPGDRAKADISLSAVPAVHLRILTSAMSSSPGSGLGVAVSRRTLGGISIPMPVSNTYTPTGIMEISGMAPGDYMLNLTSYGKEQRSWTQDVRLTGDAEVDGSHAPASPAVTGVVTLDGIPLAGQGYVSLRDPASTNAVGKVNAKGEFELPPQVVRAGTYQVAVFNVPGAAVTALSASGARVTGQSVTIEDDATIKLSVSISKGLAEIDGVAERGESPLPGAMVVLVPEKLDGNESLFRRDQSDSDGTFSLRNIVPGKYAIVAIEQGWDLEWRRAEVIAPYLANADPIEVHARGRYQVKVKVR